MQNDVRRQRKVMFLIPYPLQSAPSQRFRFEQYLTALQDKGIAYSVQSFLTVRNWRIFFERGKPMLKTIAILGGFSHRMLVLFRLHQFDLIFIHREAAPIGPPVFEWLITHILRKKIIYDFDDAIWLSDGSESKLMSIIKWRSKVKLICSWSYKVSCGNKYLSQYAGFFNPNVTINPTTIDGNKSHNPNRFKKAVNEIIAIGWTGSHTTLKYLKEIEPVLQLLEKKFDNIKFVVIADRKPSLKLSKFEFIQWNVSSEIRDLMTLDIGIMPLPDDEWSKGKCGFKLIQYLSLEIPAVASPVGVNTSIIESGINGFFASTEAEWESALTQLILDQSLRIDMGKNGRKKIERNYSVNSNTDTFLSLFK